METQFEFLLLVECCRRAFSSGDDANLTRLSATVDPGRFERLTQFHRVQGLVWNALWSAGVDLPAEVARALSADAREITATNLFIAAEGRELRAAFENAGLRIVFVKGLTVGALAYAKPMLKMGWDIDILIDDADVASAATVLANRRYQQTIPNQSADLATWHVTHKESVWSRPEQRLYVELHTRLSDNRRLIPGVGLDSPLREVEIAQGISLPTLAPDELFAYLCVHGASSLWFRLKWITDLAALLFVESPAEIERLYRRSQQLGAGRAADQALLLSDALYGSLAGNPELREELSRDRVARWLFKSAMKLVTRQSEPLEPTSRRLGTMPIHLTQFGLLPGWKFKASELVRQLRSALS